MAFQTDYRAVEQAGEITLRQGNNGKLHADTMSDVVWCLDLAGKSSFADSEVDALLFAASEYGLSLCILRTN